jgi:hypothetical protein
MTSGKNQPIYRERTAGKRETPFEPTLISTYWCTFDSPHTGFEVSSRGDMMRGWAVAIAIGFLASAQAASAFESLQFGTPDKRVAALIGKLFTDEFSRPG